MAENPSHTLLTESVDRLTHGEFENLADIWRHEGLKKVVERGLHEAGKSHLGRLGLNRLVEGGPINDPLLSTTVGGLELGGPVGLAPGWDKTGKTIQAWQALGARHITIGGVTLFPQAGNRMPRLRTMDQQMGDHGVDVSLNSFGFWNPGADKVIYNIQKQKEMGEITIPIIVQITINKEFYEPHNHHMVRDVLAMTLRKVLPIADGINLGLTSPNTPGMRDAQDAHDFMMDMVMETGHTVNQYADRNITMIIKGDGDGGERRLDLYCKLATMHADVIDAFELINTTALPHIKERYGVGALPGGIAGASDEFQQLALDSIRYLYEGAGDGVDIIGTGGVDSAGQAVKMLENGASAIGINTGVRKLGLGAMRLVEKGALMDIRTRYPSISGLDQVIGINTTRGPKINVEKHSKEWFWRRWNNQQEEGMGEK
jgi:dihydroorotate dehydrogenase